ncbi:uncharacterized protein LOC144023352 isoform X2 [Festucalex cinctus]
MEGHTASQTQTAHRKDGGGDTPYGKLTSMQKRTWQTNGDSSRNSARSMRWRASICRMHPQRTLPNDRQVFHRQETPLSESGLGDDVTSPRDPYVEGGSRRKTTSAATDRQLRLGSVFGRPDLSTKRREKNSKK